jgi:hypothetical protein
VSLARQCRQFGQFAQFAQFAQCSMVVSKTRSRGPFAQFTN